MKSHCEKSTTRRMWASEERSGGHPRTHSGVTSTHRHNSASFFPRRVTRAHRLESRAHTAIFQSHPRTQTGVTSTHKHSFASFFTSRVTRAHRLESSARTAIFQRCGGVGMMTFFCTCTHVQSAAQWTASVHTLHMSKPVM